jgi:hypothetical protein
VLVLLGVSLALRANRDAAGVQDQA